FVLCFLDLRHAAEHARFLPLAGVCLAEVVMPLGIVRRGGDRLFELGDGLIEVAAVEGGAAGGEQLDIARGECSGGEQNEAEEPEGELGTEHDRSFRQWRMRV